MVHEVAQRRKAGPQILLSVSNRRERAVLASVLHEIGLGRTAFLFQTGMAGVEDMCMAVNQAGKHSRRAEIDHGRVGRNRDRRRRSDVGDPVAANEHHLIHEESARLRVEKAAGAEGDGPGRLGREIRHDGEQSERRRDPQRSFHERPPSQFGFRPRSNGRPGNTGVRSIRTDFNCAGSRPSAVKIVGAT